MITELEISRDIGKNSGALPRTGAWWWASIAVAIVTFVVYAILVRALHPAQDHAFVPERSSLAAAVSNVVYGAPLGTVYSGILDRFLEETSSTSKVLAEAASRKIKVGQLRPNTQDGNGIGYMLVADVAFRLFGPKISSVVYTMLILMGVSALAFMYRFRDRRSAIVGLYFTALVVMLFGPLVWQNYLVIQTPIGGIRYFSVVAILPAFHLMLELTDSRELEWRTRRGDLVPAVIQVIVFLTAILVRNSAAPMIGAIAIGCLIAAWTLRADRAAASRILRKAVVMAVVGAVFIGTLLGSFSRGYIAEGRFTETVWHRIFVSLGMSPEWPYGNLREVYDCRKSIPEGLVNGPEDRNGHCVFLVYLTKNNIPFESSGGTYGRRYDASLREAFFDILRAYPVEVLHTFLVIKVQRIFWSLSEGVQLKLHIAPMRLIWLLLAAVAGLLALSIVPGSPEPPSTVSSLGRALGLFSAFSVLPFFAVWAHPQTSSDMYIYLFIGAGLAIMAGGSRIRSMILQPPR